MWTKLGLCHYRLGDMEQAQASFERARSLDPNDATTLINLASALLAQSRYGEASTLVQQALALQPGLAEAESMLLYIRQQTCDWEDLDYLVEQLRKRLAQDDAPPVAPHSLIALPFTQAELFKATRNWVERHIRPRRAPRPEMTSLVDGRLRIAYLGSDFRAHPFAHLATEVIERHDRSRFEVFGYSFGIDDGSDARARFLKAFDRFVDVRDETFEQTAKRIRADRVGILFDTGGHVIYARNEIFALRAAPIQINCMFAGTMGADYYDYIMTDAFVTPPHQQPYFSEQFLLLPHCYMPSDTRRPVGPSTTRAQCGLPESAIVFCCFNASYKILADVFAIWMRLLRDVPGSVLWLLDTDATVIANLRREAQAHAIAPHRLVFAPRTPLPQHLARHKVADLFLDTFPCNAHTTTNDALFMGLPVVTCAGDTFASRVAGSHLRAIGLPELVTSNLTEYENLARKLALDPGLLQSYRNRLAANRSSFPLFDMAAYTRAFDRLLWDAWEEWRARRAVEFTLENRS